MTREIALFTKMRSVCINDRMGNYWLVKNMRDDLSEAYIDFVTFDAFAHKDVDHIILMFSVNEELENINPQYISTAMAQFITGEYIHDCELPYPILHDETTYRLLELRYFEKMWRKNNKALGGDDFELLQVNYTQNTMMLSIRFCD